MRITEKRGFFKIQVIVPAMSINAENIKIDFKGINLYSEDEDNVKEIRNRRTIIETERCSEGLELNIFILNEGEDTSERIDYLMDEDYEIEDVFISVTHLRNGKEYETRFNDSIGEQIEKEVPIELPKELEDATNYIVDEITEGNTDITNIVFETIKSSKSLQNYINAVMELEL